MTEALNLFAQVTWINLRIAYWTLLVVFGKYFEIFLYLDFSEQFFIVEIFLNPFLDLQDIFLILK